MNNNFQYAIPIQNKDKKPNETSIYRHPDFTNKNYEETIPFKTMHEIFKKRLEAPNSDFLGIRILDDSKKLQQRFTFYNTKTIFDKSEQFGSGLLNLNLVESIKEWKNKEFKFLGFYSKNNLEYFIADIACCIYNITIIPIYDTLGEEATQFAFNQTKMKTCLVTSDHVPKILFNKKIKKQFSFLQNLIIIDYENFDKKLLEEYKDLIKVISFEQVLKKGTTKQPWANVNPNDIYAFSYTSGTTGEPKGAMLSHRNICSNVHTSRCKLSIDSSDVHLSYLPMAHALERIIFICFIAFNLKIGIYSGDILKLGEDIQILKPTLFVSVPRFYNKIYDKIQMAFKQKNRFLQNLIKKATNCKLQNLHSQGVYKHFLWDLLVFNKTKQALGGQVRVAVTGSAPISQEVIDFLKIAFQCPILEGYGQTEGTGYEFGTDPRDGISGHVGGPFTQNEFKLVDVPEMNYTSQDKDEQGRSRPRGEIWIRGPNVIPGYYKLDAKNKETFTEEGWLLSGDIGQILPDKNRLQIIDRKKNIFKLSQGEYIAPEKLEHIYKNVNNLINDVFVYGDSLKSVLVAIVQINKEDLEKLGVQLGVQNNDLQNSEEFKLKLIQEFEKARKEHNLNSLEKVKKIYIDCRSWEELGLITNSFKKKRFDIKEFYENQIEKMYENLY